jgi:hypothetical protein
MKIKMSKNQWEGIGKKAGWMKSAQLNNVDTRKKLVDMIQQIKKISYDFRVTSANLPKKAWTLIEEDCDEVVQHLDNASGRISTVIHMAYKGK